MRVLDLFCGVGGAAMGYYQPGATIVGVDIEPQPNYPFDFVQADASDYPLDGFDVLHASPPCQAHSLYRWHEHRSTGYLLEQTIERFKASDASLWVVENVQGADLREPHAFTLCGSSFGLVTHGEEPLYLVRHRKFWTNMQADAPKCACAWYRKNGWYSAGVYGWLGRRSPAQEMRYGRGRFKPDIATAKTLMGIPWAKTNREVTEAIPPAYTAWIRREAERQGLPIAGNQGKNLEDLEG